MTVAEIVITLPEEVWLSSVTAAHPTASFRVVSVQRSGETGTALLEVRAEEILPILSAVSDRQSVTEVELLWKREDEALVQLETVDPTLLTMVSDAGVPLKTPFHVADGRVTWEVTTTRRKLSELDDRLRAMGIEHEVKTVRPGGTHERPSLTTERQEEVLEAAFEAGYYDTPREATLTEVADAVGVSKATCSEILHRAEGKIVESYLDEIGAFDSVR